MSTVLVLTFDAAHVVIPWAAGIARRAGNELLVLCVAENEAPALRKASAEREDTPPAVEAALAAAAAQAHRTTVYECRGPSMHRAVRDALVDLEGSQLVLASSRDASGEAAGVIERLARSAPYDTVVLDAGNSDDGQPTRVVVPQFDGGGARAIRFAARYFEAAPIHVLQDPRALTRSKRVSGKAVAEHEDRTLHVVELPAETTLEAALPEHLERDDLVLLDADAPDRVPRALSRFGAVRAQRGDGTYAVGLTRDADAASPGRLERVREWFRAHAPALTREERRDLLTLLEEGGRLSTNFVVMLALSSAIATLGLIQSSASVVIGAMLVAPLMTPLVAIGMAIAQGNRRLLSEAGRAMGSGIAGALLVALGIGALSPWQDLSAEVLARGAPNLFDLAIALLSGIAASFALARPGLAGTLVGVAIAVALLPPLAVVGIAAVKSEFAVAGGALVLFTTNLLAIVLGSYIVFRSFGVDPTATGQRRPRWARALLAAVVVSLMATSVLLVRNLERQRRESVHRPYARALPPDLRAAIRARVARAVGVEIVLMAQSEIEHGFGLEVVLSAPDAIDPALIAELREMIEAAVPSDTRIRILRLRSGP